MFWTLKNMIALDNPFRLMYHKARWMIANIVYWFPSRKMIIIWVTWTNWKTTTTNIIAKWLRQAWKKVFMFSTINIIIWDNEFVNNSKMTSPDVFMLQKLLSQAKNEWCEIAIIETSSHSILMNRNYWLDYDYAVITNITQDHLDLHKTMENYVATKLQLFKNLISYRRKPWVKKVAVINNEFEYRDMFTSETYDNLFTYWKDNSSTLRVENIKSNENYTTFDVKIAWSKLNIETKLRWDFNVYNILAAIWVFISFWLKTEEIEKVIKTIDWVAWRMEEVENNNHTKIFVDYAHTADALKQVLETIRDIEWIKKIITVFWATGDRDKTKRPIMWKVVSDLSDVVILTQDDDYTEKTEKIIKDVLPWIERKEWEDFWIIPDRREAIRTAIIKTNPWDALLVAWKWDEHIMMTNLWAIEWHDKDVIKEILDELDDYRILK